MRRTNWAVSLMAVVSAVGPLGPAAVADIGDWPQFRAGAALGNAAGGRISVTTAAADNPKRPSGMSGGVMSLSTWGWSSAPSGPLEFQAGPEFKVLSESSLGDTEEIFWATPAVAGDSLSIRSSDALCRIRTPRP